MVRWLAAVGLSLLIPLLIPPAACGQALPERVTVATWNLEWFFDHYTGDNTSDLGRANSAPSREEWEWKLAGVTEAVAQMQPTILALQEVESRRVLYNLTRRLKDQHRLNYRVAFIEGTDFGTEQDVGVLYRSGLVEYSRREQTNETYGNKDYYNLSKHLFARFEWGQGDGRESLTLLTLHLRATPEAADIRVRQLRLARLWIEPLLRRGENLIVLGDLNSEETAQPPAPETDLGVLLGLATAEPAHQLVDLHARLAPRERATHLTGKHYDRIFVSRSLLDDALERRDLVFQAIRRPRELVVRGQRQDEDHFNVFYDIPPQERDLSDHFPVIAEFAVQ